MNYHDIITIESGKRGGKPCIRGMRITVYDVLEYLASGMSQDEVLKEFPSSPEKMFSLVWLMPPIVRSTFSLPLPNEAAFRP
jgi:uncharacterized protein (DUF433 family)